MQNHNEKLIVIFSFTITTVIVKTIFLFYSSIRFYTCYYNSHLLFFIRDILNLTKTMVYRWCITRIKATLFSRTDEILYFKSAVIAFVRSFRNISITCIVLLRHFYFLLFLFPWNPTLCWKMFTCSDNFFDRSYYKTLKFQRSLPVREGLGGLSLLLHRHISPSSEIRIFSKQIFHDSV